MKRTLGISRNKTIVLAQIRREKRNRFNQSAYLANNRFSKQRLQHGGEIELFDHHQTLKKPFIDDLSTISTIDQPKPVWLTYLQQCQTILRTVQQISTIFPNAERQMITNQNKRLTCVKVSEQKGYEMKIFDCAKSATLSIKRCEKILDAIRKQGESDSAANKRICDSICFKLATDIQSVTKDIRSQQKSFIDQRKQFQFTEKASFLQLAADHVLNQANMANYDQLIEDQAILDLEERNQEIKKIVQSIYELNDIYKQLNQLVILQGSLLDRIDENIQVSKQAVSSGHVHLTKAEKYQKKTGRCACGTIIALLLVIAILLIVLLVRWFK